MKKYIHTFKAKEKVKFQQYLLNNGDIICFNELNGITHISNFELDGTSITVPINNLNEKHFKLLLNSNKYIVSKKEVIEKPFILIICPNDKLSDNFIKNTLSKIKQFDDINFLQIFAEGYNKDCFFIDGIHKIILNYPLFHKLKGVLYVYPKDYHKNTIFKNDSSEFTYAFGAAERFINSANPNCNIFPISVNANGKKQKYENSYNGQRFLDFIKSKLNH